jgi:hypothetical protein
MVSMGIRRPTLLQEQDQVLLLFAGALSSVGTFECQAEEARVVTEIILLLMELWDCLSSVENVA